MARIYYVAQYACKEIEDENRQYSLAGAQKVETIAAALEELGHEVEIVTYGRTKSCFKWVKGSKTEISEKVFIKTFNSFGLPAPFYKIDGVLQIVQMFLYLVRKIRRKDILLAYHSLLTLRTIETLKKVKQCCLILEVEELYQDVVKCSKKKERKELEAIGLADNYIFSADELNQRLNKGKKAIVINGTYVIPKQWKESFEDQKVHCIYAGTLDSTKGSLEAIQCAAFLPSNYHVHILGFGSSSEKEEIEKCIQRVREKTNCEVTYDGVLEGEKYIRFLQKCHIGLCTQTPQAKYSETSFPSKIFVYLANGLEVVTIRIPVIENSQVGEVLHYYEKQDPYEIAKAIIRVAKNKKNRGVLRLQELQKIFVQQIGALLEDFRIKKGSENNKRVY